MEKEKANISLQSAAQLRHCGLRLALRKGIGELCCRRRHIRRKVALPADTAALPLSIIICTLGTCKVLEDAIRAALMQDLAQSDYEVLVVWNRADAPPAADFPPQVRWVREPETGLSRARNTGAAHARGAVLLFLDDDAVAAPNLASVMKETFSRHKDAAIVGGQIFLPLPNPRPAAVLSRAGSALERLSCSVPPLSHGTGAVCVSLWCVFCHSPRCSSCARRLFGELWQNRRKLRRRRGNGTVLSFTAARLEYRDSAQGAGGASGGGAAFYADPCQKDAAGRYFYHVSAVP